MAGISSTNIANIPRREIMIQLRCFDSLRMNSRNALGDVCGEWIALESVSEQRLEVGKIFALGFYSIS